MKRFNKMYLPVFLATLTMGMSACDKKDHSAERVGKSIDQSVAKTGDKIDDQSDKLGVFMDDSAITAKVKAAILAESDLTAPGINVETVKGVTTVSGDVNSATVRDRVENVVAKVEGVKSVNNNLTVVADK